MIDYIIQTLENQWWLLDRVQDEEDMFTVAWITCYYERLRATRYLRMSHILPQYPMLKVMADSIIAETIDNPDIMAFAPEVLWDFVMANSWRDGVNDEYVSQASPR